jgi:hypothetical protein
MSTLTVTRIEERLAGLKQQYLQIVTNANLVQGAIQLCEQLLEEAKTEAEGEKSPSVLSLVAAKE